MSHLTSLHHDDRCTFGKLHRRTQEGQKQTPVCHAFIRNYRAGERRDKKKRSHVQKKERKGPLPRIKQPFQHYHPNHFRHQKIQEL
jgi:hypothetical protein